MAKKTIKIEGKRKHQQQVKGLPKKFKKTLIAENAENTESSSDEIDQKLVEYTVGRNESVSVDDNCESILRDNEGNSSSDDEVIEEKIFREDIHQVNAVKNTVKSKYKKAIKILPTNLTKSPSKNGKKKLSDNEENSTDNESIALNLTEDTAGGAETPLTIVVSNFEPNLLAYVTFKDKNAIKPALGLNGNKLLSNKIKVELLNDNNCKTNLQKANNSKPTQLVKRDGLHSLTDEAKSRTVIVRELGMLYRAHEHLLETFRNCGQIVAINKLVRKNVIGFITFAEESGVKNALKMNGEFIYNRKIVVEKFREGFVEFKILGVRLHKLNVITDADKLKSIFSKYGEVKDVKITLSRRTPTKFADAEILLSPESAVKSALEANNMQVDDMPIRVSELIIAKLIK